MKRIIRGAEYLIREITKEDIFVPEEFNEEQRAMADMVYQFVREEVIPDTDAMEQQNFDLVLKHLRKAADLGLMMLDAPEEYGGLEMDKVTDTIIDEQIGRSSSFSVSFAAHTGIGTMPIIYYGSEVQLKKYMEKIISGECFTAYCLTEAEAGSDAMGIKSHAHLSENKTHYILNGTKQFITNAGFADLFIVFAKIDKEDFSAFLVERAFEGVIVGPEEKKMGIKGSSTCSVTFEECKVPVENLLGVQGKGHKIAFNILNSGRLKLGACCCGAAKETMREAILYTKQRKQFDSLICQFGAIREKIAAMTVKTFTIESMVYRLSGDLDRCIQELDRSGDSYYEECAKVMENYSVECSIVKVFASECLRDIIDEAVQIHGGYGYIQEYSVERLYRDERINRIFEGTNEINRLLISASILKKAMKNELPLQQESLKAFDAMITPSFEEVDEEIPFAAEKILLQNLKRIYLILAGAAVQKFQKKIADEQEILIAAANMAIQIYALECVILRAEKNSTLCEKSTLKQLEAIVTCFAFESAESLSHTAKKCAHYVEEGDNLLMILSGIRRFTKYNASGLLQAIRLLAEQAVQKGKYIF